jgi:serine/threonine protein phosphatase 1|tara:strand:+ start:4590 stop:5546 length:957 start_codon:yes stop_codon:yes gene_type:complete
MTASISPWYSHPYSTAGRRIFVIGDVHGMLEPMESVLETFRELAGEGGPEGADLVWLGDVIDRGPESAACLQAYLADDPAFENVARLCGNHEQMMLLGLGFHPHRDRSEIATRVWQGIRYQTWLSNGGVIASHSFRAAACIPDLEEDALEDLIAANREALDEISIDLPSKFYEGQGASYRVGDLLFVHAGVHPFRDLEEFLARPWWEFPTEGTDPEENFWSWIRGPFLIHPYPAGERTLVLHGHTPQRPAIELFSERDVPFPDNCADADQVAAFVEGGGHRIYEGKLNLDGGSFDTGLVVGVQIEDGRYRIIAAWGQT